MQQQPMRYRDPPNACDVTLSAWPDLGIPEARVLLEERDFDAPLLAVALKDPSRIISEVCAFLADTVRQLFPAWLPEADGIERAGGLGAEAVSVIARRGARNGIALGAVMEPLALAALRDKPADLSHLADETAVRECMRLIETSYGEKRVTSLLYIAAEPDAASDRELLAHGVAWLVGLNVCAVRLCGPGSATVKGVYVEPLVRPGSLLLGVRQKSGLQSAQLIAHGHYVTPLAGRPSPNSEVEQRVERYLSLCDWAAGRQWQVPWQADVLSTPIRTDLLFPAADLVVEFDGPEHAGITIYSADRRRDRLLMAHGFMVVRFTNAEVENDIERVAAEIRSFLEYQEGRVT